MTKKKNHAQAIKLGKQKSSDFVSPKEKRKRTKMVEKYGTYKPKQDLGLRTSIEAIPDPPEPEDFEKPKSSHGFIEEKKRQKMDQEDKFKPYTPTPPKVEPKSVIKIFNPKKQVQENIETQYNQNQMETNKDICISPENKSITQQNDQNFLQFPTYLYTNDKPENKQNDIRKPLDNQVKIEPPKPENQNKDKIADESLITSTNPNETVLRRRTKPLKLLTKKSWLYGYKSSISSDVTTIKNDSINSLNTQINLAEEILKSLETKISEQQQGFPNLFAFNEQNIESLENPLDNLKYETGENYIKEILDLIDTKIQRLLANIIYGKELKSNKTRLLGEIESIQNEYFLTLYEAIKIKSKEYKKLKNCIRAKQRVVNNLNNQIELLKNDFNKQNKSNQSKNSFENMNKQMKTFHLAIQKSQEIEFNEAYTKSDETRRIKDEIEYGKSIIEELNDKIESFQRKLNQIIPKNYNFSIIQSNESKSQTNSSKLFNQFQDAHSKNPSSEDDYQPIIQNNDNNLEFSIEESNKNQRLKNYWKSLYLFLNVHNVNLQNIAARIFWFNNLNDQNKTNNEIIALQREFHNYNEDYEREIQKIEELMKDLKIFNETHELNEQNEIENEESNFTNEYDNTNKENEDDIIENEDELNSIDNNTFINTKINENSSYEEEFQTDNEYDNDELFTNENIEDENSNQSYNISQDEFQNEEEDDEYDFDLYFQNLYKESLRRSMDLSGLR